MEDASPEMLSLFAEAIERPSPEERVAFLDAACGSDTELRRRIEALLQAHDDAGAFLQDRPRTGNSLATTDTPLSDGPGTVIGRYKLLEQLGEGGFGVVFLAEQTAPVRRKVALKVLKPGMDTRHVVARFEAERQALALMDHPNIARVFDGGATPSGRPYFVMELVKGVPITDFCDRNNLTVRQRLELFVSVCQAVQHAHHKGIVHRDLKPSNILVTMHDTAPVVKVIDFGIAKALGQTLTDRTLFTGFTQLIGTPLYMPPEQAGQSALDVDTRSDIYSLGVLLYELLTGTTPFTRDQFQQASPDEICRIIREEDPPRPSTRLTESKRTLRSISAQRQTEPAQLTKLVRGELDWIAMKCLEKDRNRRYETASALAADVQRYLRDEPVQACPPTAWYRFRKFAGRNRRAVATAAVVVLVVLLGVGGLARSTVLIAAALKSESEAKKRADETLERERVEAYFRRITLAYHAQAADDLGRALRFLDDCPEDLRGWEWHCLIRLCLFPPVILDNKAEVHGLAFSPDGQTVAAGCGDGTVKFWDCRTGTMLRSLEAHAGPVFAVAYHPEGTHLASVGAVRQGKVWDLATSRPVFQERCDAMHNVGTAGCVAFSPDGRLLALGSEAAVRLWDWRSRRPLPVHTFPGHERRAISVAFRRDGRRLASGNWHGWLDLWDPEAGGASLCSFPKAREVFLHPVGALSFNPDGSRLATANFARRVDVWDTSTGELIHMLPHGGLTLTVAYSPDGHRLASSGEDKVVRIWAPATGREVLALEGHTGQTGCVAFSPDGHRLASASTDGTIRIWDATPLSSRTGPEILTLTDDDEIWSLAVSPDGERVASAGWGKNFTKVWDLRTGRVSIDFPGIRDVVFCVAWHPDGHRIAVAGRQGEIMQVTVWDAQTGDEIYPLEARPGEPEFFAVAFSPDRRHLVTGRHNGAVQVWDAETGKPIRLLGAHGRVPVRGIVFSPDGKQLATVSGDGVVKFWDATRLDAPQDEPRPWLKVRTHGPCVNGAFSPDGQRFAAGGQKNTVQIWNVQARELLRTLEGPRGDVYTLAFSPNGRWIAAAGEGSTVRVWDSQTGVLVRSFRGHTALVSSLAFTPDGKRIVSGSRDRTVKVWDVSTLDEVPDR